MMFQQIIIVSKLGSGIASNLLTENIRDRFLFQSIMFVYKAVLIFLLKERFKSTFLLKEMFTLILNSWIKAASLHYISKLTFIWNERQIHILNLWVKNWNFYFKLQVFNMKKIKSYAQDFNKISESKSINSDIRLRLNTDL